MKKIFLLLFLLSLFFTSSSVAQSSEETAELFKLKCGICHTIGGGRLVGPDLVNIQDKREEGWLVDFIRSSQTMVKNEDPDAVAIYEEYNKVLMPDPMISDTEIKALLGYIAEESGGGTEGGEAKTDAAPEQVSAIEDATPDNLENGKNLFEGRVRFANGGPSCISCHNDLSSTFFAENSYSTKDISMSFANLGEKGTKAILENPPFPVMAKAFEGRELEEGEVRDLLVFLKNSGANDAKMTSGYMLYGLLGAFALIVLFGGFWYNRKNRSVNHSIYQRQIKSTN